MSNIINHRKDSFKINVFEILTFVWPMRLIKIPVRYEVFPENMESYSAQEWNF